MQSRLEIVIDSRSSEQRAEELRRKLDALEKSGSRVGRAMDQSSTSINAQRDELDRLLGRIDPVVGKLSQLDKMEQQLRKHHKAGILPTDDFDEHLKKLNTTRQAVGGFGEQMDRAGKSSGQARMALQQLPMQFTDIWVSLAAGQNPMTVFIQQGTQIKDSFGGAGPALKAMAGYLKNMITPLTASAAAATAVGVAMYQAASRTDEFEKALALTNNGIGSSVSELQRLADAIGEQTGNAGAARDAILQMVNSGESSLERLSTVASHVALRNKATGESVEDLIKQYDEIRKGPAKALVELSDKYNFLTAEQYKHIRALEAQGDSQEAVTYATRVWGDASDDAANRIIENMNSVDRSLNWLKGEFRDFWDWLGEAGEGALSRALGGAGVGNNSDRINFLKDQVSELKQELDRPWWNPNPAADTFEAQLRTFQSELTIRQSIAEAQQLSVSLTGDQQSAQSEIIQTLETGLNNAKQYRTTQAQVNDLFDTRKQQVAALAEAGNPTDRAAIEDSIEAIDSRIDSLKRSTAAYRDNQAAQREAAKSAQDFARALEMQDRQYRSLMDSLYPVQASYRNFTDGQNTLNTAYEQGKLTVEGYLNALNRLYAAQQSVQSASQAYGQGFGAEIGSRGDVGSPTDPSAMGAGQSDQWDQWLESARTAFTDFDNLNRQAAESFTGGMGDAIESMVFDFENLGDAAQGVFEGVGRTFVNTLGQMGSQWLAYQAIQLATGQSTQAAASAGAAANGAAMAAAYAPAAAMASLASFGSNAIPAQAGLSATTALATSLAASSGFAGLFDKGGDIASDKWGIVGERGPEIVQGPARVTSRVDTSRIMSAARSGASNGSSNQTTMAPINVTVNNQTDSRVSTRSDGKGGLTIDIVKAELAKDFKTDGQVARAGRQAFTWERRGK